MAAERSRSRDLGLAIRRQKRVVLLFGFAILVPAVIVTFRGGLETLAFRRSLQEAEGRNS
jgi:hypothetical protein